MRSFRLSCQPEVWETKSREHVVQIVNCLTTISERGETTPHTGHWDSAPLWSWFVFGCSDCLTAATETLSPQEGHLRGLPTNSSLTNTRLPHLQVTSIAIPNSGTILTGQ